MKCVIICLQETKGGSVGFYLFSDINSEPSGFKKLKKELPIYFLGNLFGFGNSSIKVLNEVFSLINTSDVELTYGITDLCLYRILGIDYVSNDIMITSIKYLKENNGKDIITNLFEFDNLDLCFLIDRVYDANNLDELDQIKYIKDVNDAVDKMIESNSSIYFKLQRVYNQSTDNIELEFSGFNLFLGNTDIPCKLKKDLGITQGPDLFIMGGFNFLSNDIKPEYKLYNHISGTSLVNQNNGVVLINKNTSDNIIEFTKEDADIIVGLIRNYRI